MQLNQYTLKDEIGKVNAGAHCSSASGWLGCPGGPAGPGVANEDTRTTAQMGRVLLSISGFAKAETTLLYVSKKIKHFATKIQVSFQRNPVLSW